MRQHLKAISILACTVILLSFSMVTFAVEKGAMGELSFTSTNTSPTNKFDVNLSAVFTKDGTSYTFQGFYASTSPNTWKIRYNLPLTGTWSYTTVALEDSQLNNRTGSVSITAPSGANKGCLVKDGRRVKWENTGATYLFRGNTAWWLTRNLDYNKQPTINYQTSLNWMALRFNHVLVDLYSYEPTQTQPSTWYMGGTPAAPDWDRFNLVQWNRVDEIVQYAQSKGISLEFGPYLQEYWKAGMSSSQITRLSRYIAARLGAYPHVIYSGPCTEYPNSQNDVTTINSMYLGLSNAFHRRPLMGMHPYRNHAYFTSNADYRYHAMAAPGFAAAYTGQAWLTLGTFHEANMFDGWGILQHRYQADYNMPLYVHEGKYEKSNGTLAPQDDNDLDDVLTNYGLTDINNDPKRYYRWYAWGSLLSGGSGISYGMESDWEGGYPNGYDPTGYQDIKKQEDYYLAKGFSPNACDNKDVDIDSPNTTSGSGMWDENRGLKRPKMLKATDANKYLIYNPYDTNVTIQNVPAEMNIEIFNPQTNLTYSGGTTGTSPFTFTAPPQFTGEYVLYISTPGVVYQAEDAAYSGAVVATNQTGYTGTGFIDYINSSNDYIEWTVSAAAAGTYTLEFRYALSSGDRPLSLSVDGIELIHGLSFPYTGGSSTWSTVSCNVSLDTPGSHTIRLTATDYSGPNIDKLTVTSQVDQTLKLDLNFNEESGTTAYDSTSYDNNATLYGNAHFSGFGELLLDGSGDYASPGTPTNLELGTDDMTIVARVNIASGSNVGIVTKGAEESSNAGYGFYYNGGQLVMVLGNGTTRLWLNSNNVGIIDNTWHTVAVSLTRSGNAVFYRDGVDVGSESAAALAGVNIVNTAREMRIGSRFGYHYLNGQVERVRIYKRAMTAAEIAALQ